MNVLYANLSTDLRRISNWIMNGNRNLVMKTIDQLKTRYKGVQTVGVYNNIWVEIGKIKENKEGDIRAADRATTLGSILLQEALKN